MTPPKTGRQKTVSIDDRADQLFQSFDHMVSLGSAAFRDDGGVENPQTPLRGKKGRAMLGLKTYGCENLASVLGVNT